MSQGLKQRQASIFHVNRECQAGTSFTQTEPKAAITIGNGFLIKIRQSNCRHG